MGTRRQGLTLIELVIVVAIMGVLAGILLPNLLNSRARAFDTSAQACLRETATREEVLASVAPYLYDSTLTAAALPASSACMDDAVTLASVGGTAPVGGVPAATTFRYNAHHERGTSLYTVSAGAGVSKVGPRP
jgi:prepilin-type N-terminal cleavage/methylation domain-containing protein